MDFHDSALSEAGSFQFLPLYRWSWTTVAKLDLVKKTNICSRSCNRRHEQHRDHSHTCSRCKFNSDKFYKLPIKYHADQGSDHKRISHIQKVAEEGTYTPPFHHRRRQKLSKRPWSRVPPECYQTLSSAARFPHSWNTHVRAGYRSTDEDQSDLLHKPNTAATSPPGTGLPCPYHKSSSSF